MNKRRKRKVRRSYAAALAAAGGDTGLVVRAPELAPDPRVSPKVPYIALWSSEVNGVEDPRFSVVGGITYLGDEVDIRDPYGVLWARMVSQRGVGKPLFGVVHGLRQQECMNHLRCQVCGGPADRTQEGVLWLIDADPNDLKPEELTLQPPVCWPCADFSQRACPHLRKAATLLRVRIWRPCGVRGIAYLPTITRTLSGQTTTIAALHMDGFTYDDPRLPYVLAHQQVISLTNYTVVPTT